MGASRVFYVTQGSLVVWQQGDGSGTGSLTFPDSDAGLEAFGRYLERDSAQPGFVLVDVIEEEFALETLPKLGPRDRGALLGRRLERKFARSPFRTSVYLGRRRGSPDECSAVFSAISNHELLDPWLDLMSRAEVPLTGISSVPLVAPGLAARLFKPAATALMLTQHQGDRLRQVYLRDGAALSARLSATPAVADPGYAGAVITEIQRSRRYLERTRLLDPMQTLDVLLVADAATADAIVEQAQSRMPLDFHIVTPARAAARLRVKRLAGDRLERLYVAEALRRRPRRGYATSGETRYWTMTRIRHAIVATSIAASLVCATLAGALFSDGWMLKARTAAIERQVAQLSETLRRENDAYSPIRADSHEMKLAVDTGDFLLANRLPVPWVMQQLGFVLGEFPDVRVRRLEWRAEEPATAPAGGRVRRDATLPVVVPAVARVSAELTAELVPFDGDMRAAFARVDALVAALASGTDFPEVTAVEYPIDARSDAAIAGDITALPGADGARFRIRLVYPLATATAVTEGPADAT